LPVFPRGRTINVFPVPNNRKENTMPHKTGRDLILRLGLVRVGEAEA
jgi:hypothetical protein